MKKEVFHFFFQLFRDVWASRLGRVFAIGWAVAVMVMSLVSPHITTLVYALAVFAVHSCSWSALLCAWRYRRQKDHLDILETAQRARQEFENVLEQHGFHRIREEGNVIPLDWKKISPRPH